MSFPALTPDDYEALLSLYLVSGNGMAVLRTTLSACQGANLAPAALMEVAEREMFVRAPLCAETFIAARRLCRVEHRRKAHAQVDRLLDRGGFILTRLCKGYPDSLTSCLGDAAPPLLFLLGYEGLFRTATAAIVGSRTPSTPGARLARALGKLYAENGVTVVSGSAQGVDTEAQESALTADGALIAVLPLGIAAYNMPDYLSDAIACGAALVISEFPPEQSWATFAAVQRNATIAALGRCVCTIEPRKPGGSMKTARHGYEQGKKIFGFAPGTPEAAELLQRANAVMLPAKAEKLPVTELLDAVRGIPVQPHQADLFG
jgi:predicted Rossmann fold nucleotide-binding protein DprA/Smf involved in DNA uptake